MNRDKQIEEIKQLAKDIFAPKVALDGIDLAFASVHGADMEDSHFMRIAKHLYAKGYRKASDVAREVFEEIEKQLARYSHLHRYAEEAHKVTEEYADGSPVEMTSVWDACRLENNGYDDYETMCQLQDNIGNIEKSRLLKEFECDIAQLKKKYESEGADDEGVDG